MHPLPGEISFGHDIEGSWLLTEAAEVLEAHAADKARAKALVGRRSASPSAWWISRFRAASMRTAACSTRAMRRAASPCRTKVWWAQAEAVVGCVNAWQITGDEKYLDTAWKVWTYIKAQVINGPAGEWLASGRNSPDEENSHLLCGPWKCPTITPAPRSKSASVCSK